MKIACRVVLVCLSVFCITTTVFSQTIPFNFVALGDLPYGDTRRVDNRYRRLIHLINSRSPSFSIHVGDFKSGSSECSDLEFKKQFDYFNLFEGALVYTPGDNDWTDCHRFVGKFDRPLERLSVLRTLFFAKSVSLGKDPITVERQPDVALDYSSYPENQRWILNQVLFVTLHVVGSNNNYDPSARDPNKNAEFIARDNANIDWIRSAFELAANKSLGAIVFAFQGDVFVEKSSIELFPLSSGFKTSIGDNLIALAAQTKLPVLLIHGDSHQYEFDQPFFINRKKIDNLTRLEVPGAQDVRAVEVSVDLGSASPFRAKLIGEEPF